MSAATGVVLDICAARKCVVYEAGADGSAALSAVLARRGHLLRAYTQRTDRPADSFTVLVNGTTATSTCAVCCRQTTETCVLCEICGGDVRPDTVTDSPASLMIRARAFRTVAADAAACDCLVALVDPSEATLPPVLAALMDALPPTTPCIIAGASMPAGTGTEAASPTAKSAAASAGLRPTTTTILVTDAHDEDDGKEDDDDDEDEEEEADAGDHRSSGAAFSLVETAAEIAAREAARWLATDSHADDEATGEEQEDEEAGSGSDDDAVAAILRGLSPGASGPAASASTSSGRKVHRWRPAGAVTWCSDPPAVVVRGVLQSLGGLDALAGAPASGGAATADAAAAGAAAARAATAALFPVRDVSLAGVAESKDDGDEDGGGVVPASLLQRPLTAETAAAYAARIDAAGLSILAQAEADFL